MPFVTRFAPSPTGPLHLGHAYSALLAHDMARHYGGTFLLRIEDIDASRSREPFITAILRTLDWLKITWDGPVRRQSEHMDSYRNAVERLQAMGLLYPCICTRKEIAQEIASASSAPHGPEGALYPGLCKRRSRHRLDAMINQGHPYALRLDMARALQQLCGQNLTFQDMTGTTYQARPQDLGDVVLARKDTPTSYHLSVTLDDAKQGITHVIRGEDLLQATHIHRLLQALLNLPTPIYCHHPLLTDSKGERLAKRHNAPDLESLRRQGWTADDVRREITRLLGKTAKMPLEPLPLP